jgi:hypothetical protein
MHLAVAEMEDPLDAGQFNQRHSIHSVRPEPVEGRIEQRLIEPIAIPRPNRHESWPLSFSDSTLLSEARMPEPPLVSQTLAKKRIQPDAD